MNKTQKLRCQHQVRRLTICSAQHVEGVWLGPVKTGEFPEVVRPLHKECNVDPKDDEENEEDQLIVLAKVERRELAGPLLFYLLPREPSTYDVWKILEIFDPPIIHLAVTSTKSISTAQTSPLTMTPVTVTPLLQ